MDERTKLTCQCLPRYNSFRHDDTLLCHRRLKYSISKQNHMVMQCFVFLWSYNQPLTTNWLMVIQRTRDKGGGGGGGVKGGGGGGGGDLELRWHITSTGNPIVLIKRSFNCLISTYLHNAISYIGKIQSLYWLEALKNLLEWNYVNFY